MRRAVAVASWDPPSPAQCLKAMVAPGTRERQTAAVGFSWGSPVGRVSGHSCVMTGVHCCLSLSKASVAMVAHTSRPFGDQPTAPTLLRAGATCSANRRMFAMACGCDMAPK